MEIKVKKAVGSAQKTTSTLDLTSNLDLSDRLRSQIHRDVGQYLVESILSDTNKAKSPLTGESLESLSPEYKKKKEAEGLPGKPNLEETGAMLDALEFEETDDGIELGWFGDQAAKADGHNNFSGKSDLPERRIIPGEDEEFRPAIQKEIKKIIADAIADNISIPKDELDGVSSKSELYGILTDYFPGLSRSEIRSAVSRTPEIASLLDEFDLLQYL